MGGEKRASSCVCGVLLVNWAKANDPKKHTKSDVDQNNLGELE